MKMHEQTPLETKKQLFALLCTVLAIISGPATFALPTSSSAPPAEKVETDQEKQPPSKESKKSKESKQNKEQPLDTQTNNVELNKMLYDIRDATKAKDFKELDRLTTLFLERVSLLPRPNPYYARSFYERGAYYYAVHKMQPAIDLFHLFDTQAEAKLKQFRPYITHNCLTSLASAEYSMRRLSDAQRDYRRALEFAREQWGPYCNEYGEDLAGLGNCELVAGNYAEAEKDLRVASKLLFDLNNDSESLRLIRTACSYGMVEYSLSKLDEAIASFQMALNLLKACDLKDEDVMERANMGLAKACISRGDYDRAETALQYLLSQGKEHDKVDVITMMAEVQLERADYNAAIVGFQSALDRLEKEAKPSAADPRWKICLEYSEALRRQGRLAEAADYMNKAVEWSKRTHYSQTEAVCLHQAVCFYQVFAKNNGADLSRWRSDQDSVRDALFGSATRGTVVSAASAGATSIPTMCISREKGKLDLKFVSGVQQACDEIPAPVKAKLIASGIRVLLVHSCAEVWPERAKQRPPGYSEGQDHRAMKSFYDHALIACVIGETFETPYRKSNVEIAELSSMVKHEMAHALDDYLGKYSSTAEFRAAYAEDCSNMPKQKPSHISYYLQKGKRGRIEAFAELCAINWGSKHFADMAKLFPAANKVVQDELKDLTAGDTR